MCRIKKLREHTMTFHKHQSLTSCKSLNSSASRCSGLHSNRWKSESWQVQALNHMVCIRTTLKERTVDQEILITKRNRAIHAVHLKTWISIVIWTLWMKSMTRSESKSSRCRRSHKNTLRKLSLAINRGISLVLSPHLMWEYTIIHHCELKASELRKAHHKITLNLRNRLPSIAKE